MQTETFTTSTDNNTDTTTYAEVDLQPGSAGAPTGARDGGSQVLRIGADIDNAGGTAANLRFVLRDTATVYKYVDVTLTVSAIRSAAAGGAGNYQMTVAGTTNDWIDLTGYDPGNGRKWYVGMAGAIAGSASTVNVYLWPTRAI